MKKTRKETSANLLKEDNSIEKVDAGSLKKGDIVIVNTGELIPNDGVVIEGIASVDESAITGESAPVIKEAGGDFSSVTGGTRVVSDKIKVQDVYKRQILSGMVSLTIIPVIIRIVSFKLSRC